METPILANFSCATKLPYPPLEEAKPCSPNLSSFLSRTPQQTGTLGSLHGTSTLGNSSKESSYSISRGAKRSSIRKKISFPSFNEKKKHYPIYTEGFYS
jgi:hypothetical protein